ncbi:ATP-dependent zinc metalloprotease FtsH, partial [Eubacteriales bacterium OttesenSCG-928-N13]|nr:ATP-dependent zinc metalloprotease FtsH [Eubacteriales bacterium OttesenSCG-928-N13]
MYVVLIVVVLVAVNMISGVQTDQVEQLDYTQLLTRIESNDITKVCFTGNDQTGNTLVALKKDSAIPEEQFPARYDILTTNTNTSRFYDDVDKIYAKMKNVPVDQVSVTDYAFSVQQQMPAPTPWWIELLPMLIMIALFMGVWYFLMRQQSGGGKGVMSFGRSKARLTEPGKMKTTFADVAGADEEKEELREIVEFLRDPKKFTDLGARIPKGVLLVGPPGTGKTLLAKAVSGEAAVPFFTISGSDFVEMFVGVGASRVRDLFDQAKKSAPSIVFIDEIDAVGRQRGAGMGGGHDEREQTLNQLLVEMDGFSHNEGVIVMAATNRADILDPALLRPGRFDRQVSVNYPDIKGREEIMKVHARGKPLDADVSLNVLAKKTPFFTGADLENVLNEAAILTARKGMHSITMETLEEAITKVQMGPEKKSYKVTALDKRLVAYHEAGHAIVMNAISGRSKVHEVSIIPRGKGAGGYTLGLPGEETNFVSKTDLLERICFGLGGRCAEQLVLGDVSTGASSDIKQVTQIARGMVTEYGMSEELGPIFLGGDHEVFLGRDFSQSRSTFSEEVNKKIDAEVSRIIEEQQERANVILTENRVLLDELAELLLAKEKVDEAEFVRLMNGDSVQDIVHDAEEAERVAREAAKKLTEEKQARERVERAERERMEREAREALRRAGMTPPS